MKKSFIYLPALAMFAWVGFTATSPGLTVPFVETFNTGDSGWFNGSSAAPDWYSSGGVDNSGYISFENSITTGAGSSYPGAPAGLVTQILMRGNSANSASGGAFVGNWLTGGVISLSLTIRHNYDDALNLYTRLAGTGGAGASLSYNAAFTIAPNTWTTILIPITDSNPPFLSYGSSDFNGVFSNLQNLQFGLYLPEYTTFTDLKFDIDNVSIVPEPTTAMFLVVAALGMMFVALRRRQAVVSEKSVPRISQG